MIEKVGFFASCLCRLNAAGLVLDFHCIKKSSAQFHMVVKLEFFVCIWVSQSPLVCSLGLSPISVGFWTTLSPNVALDGYQKKTPRACYVVFSQSVVVCDDVYECSLFFYRM